MMQMGSGQSEATQKFLSYVHTHVHRGSQALATLTPAGQLGTPDRFGLIDGEEKSDKSA